MELYRIVSEEERQELRRETEERIQDILHTPNMVVPVNVSVYYVSMAGCDTADGRTPQTAWASLDRVNAATFAHGTFVCFERGGVWRGQLVAQAGVTYTAYGEGNKPRLYISPENGAQTNKWTATEWPHVWRWDGIERDVGTIVFNEGEYCAFKRTTRNISHSAKYRELFGEQFTGVTDLKQDLHFWHDPETHALFLCSEKNPAIRFWSVEFCVGYHSVLVRGDDVTIDNLCIKYGGTHGISAGTRRNLTVTNCEFGWIGGSYPIFDAERLGNAVQIYGGCDGYTVEHCYFYQIYDAAVTHQYDLKSDERDKQAVIAMEHIRYADNVMEYCNYSIEYFLNTGSVNNGSYMDDVQICNNHMWHAGEGFCSQRPDRGQAAHIKSWNHQNRASRYRIEGNVLAYSADMLFHICSRCRNEDGTDSMPVMGNNRLVGCCGQILGRFGQRD